MKPSAIAILEAISFFLIRGKCLRTQVSFWFSNRNNCPLTIKLNKALQLCYEEERIKLTTELLDLWMNGNENDIEQIFGEAVNLRQPHKAMFTLTENRNQLRVWYGTEHGRIVPDHVYLPDDGTNLLFSVDGQPDLISNYFRSFLFVGDFTEVFNPLFPQGYRRFMLREYNQ